MRGSVGYLTPEGRACEARKASDGMLREDLRPTSKKENMSGSIRDGFLNRFLAMGVLAGFQHLDFDEQF
jgi:hypothetical protein